MYSEAENKLNGSGHDKLQGTILVNTFKNSGKSQEKPQSG
jgi:hypothetical protein